jgi:hypothetical protein
VALNFRARATQRFMFFAHPSTSETSATSRFFRQRNSGDSDSDIPILKQAKEEYAKL